MAASSSSAAAAAEPRLPKYDVFISFRGEDTRKGFTSHLYSALSGKQIEAYIDEVSLEKGDTISRALPEAIKESEISIIIFSENYGESRWCLDELVHILKRREEKDQIVLPIFYNIDPSHIRHQKGTYAAAFVKHEERFEMEEVQKWRQALKDAAAISGWVSRNMSESEIVEQVAKRVRTELDAIMSKRSDDLKGLVGIPERLEKIKSYLDSPAIRVGIWGMGGIGKTTLAKAVFDRFCNDFEGSYFAPNVRENAIDNKGLDTLKKEVYSKLLGDKKLATANISAVNHKLSRKRILLVLDDVEDAMQFEDLVGDPYRFCPGSKIIVTSRDKLKVDKEYKVEELDSKDARKLFYLNAFGHESCRRGFEGISDRVVDYTKGLPLALKVLGASVFYFRKTIEDWEKELKKLERTGNEKIQKVLEISYDALDAEEKGLFLDIACFFKGERRDFVEGILEDKPIAGLVNKSLITIELDKIQMHDLIQEMGRDIVLRSTKKLGERSRLWIAEDVSDVLENNKGTEAIEGIYPPWIYKDLHLRPDVFKEMSKLRLLKITPKVYIDGDLKYLPNGLRYLHWEQYPGKSLPLDINPQYLVELRMPNSKLEQLWDGVQKLGSLKHINLYGSKHLTKIPDLSLAPKMTSINISDCRSLICIPSLNLQATSDESAYRSHRWHERTPGCVILSACESLRTLPKVSGNIRVLFLSGNALEELPSSIESLENLLILDIAYCYNLKRLPKLPRNIEVLLMDYSGIEQISSSSIECLCSLREFSLSYCSSLKSLPSNIGMLYKLKELDISDCKNLRSLPELPLFIEDVNAKDCSSLEMVSTSRSTHTPRGLWHDNYGSDNYCHRREFSFLNCTNLGEDAINNIFREFLYKVFCTATTPPQVVVSKEQIVIRKLVVCYPTKEIPRWFNNQSEGSSITITLPPNWYNPKTFLGFVVSVVVFKDEDDHAAYFRIDHDSATVQCKLCLMTNKDRFRVDVLDGPTTIPFDHILMCYTYFDHSKENFEKYQEACLKFNSDGGRVKRCGVRMLYLKDAVEESDDGTTANFESWRIDSDTDYATTYDSDVPPPKRTRNL